MEAVNASASGDLSVRALASLTMNQLNSNAPTKTAPRNRPQHIRNSHGKRPRPYGSTSTPGSTRKRRRLGWGAGAADTPSIPKSIPYSALQFVQGKIRGRARRTGWNKRCQRIKDTVRRRFEQLEMTEIKSKIGVVLTGAYRDMKNTHWRQELSTGDAVDVLTLGLRWVSGEIISTEGDCSLDIRHSNHKVEVTTQLSRHSVRILPANTNTLNVFDGCTHEQANHGVWDTRCQRSQTWRLPLRAGSELDVLWSDGKWYSGVVTEVLQNGSYLRIQPLATNAGSTDDTIVIYRGSCRIVPYNTLVDLNMEPTDVQEHQVAQAAFCRSPFAWQSEEEPLKKIKMRLLNIAEATNPALVVIDWDDTLFPTTHVMHANKTQGTPHAIPHPTQEHWDTLTVELHKLLSQYVNAVGSGNVIILTNAGKDWVKMSWNTFLPSVGDILSHCQILSAREGYQTRYPHTEWKRHAFQQRLEEMWGMEVEMQSNPIRYVTMEQEMLSYWPDDVNKTETARSDTEMPTEQAWKISNDMSLLKLQQFTEYNLEETRTQQKQLISIGDSVLERQASIEFGSKIPNCWVKTIKLDSTPSIERLTQEIGDILEYSPEILHHQGSLDLDVGHLYPELDAAEATDGAL